MSASAARLAAAPPATALKPADLRKLQARAHKVTELLRAMANETRLLVLCQLLGGERSVTELQELTGSSQSAVSQHLAVLRELKVVATRRAGQVVYYRLASADVAAIIETLHSRFCAIGAG